MGAKVSTQYYDVPTKHGTLGIHVEIVSEGRVDDYDTLDFAVTITLPHGFSESDTRIKHTGSRKHECDKIILELDTAREITNNRT